MGRRDERYPLSGIIELNEGFFSTVIPEDQGKPLKRGRGSQKKSKVLVMAESEPVEKKVTKRGKSCRVGSQPVTFRNLNLKFYNEFMDYLFYKAEKPDGNIGLLTNSAGKVVRLLKGFVNYQVAKGVIPAVDLKNFKVVEEETDAIYLNEKELAAIYKLDLSSDKELEKIRDIFIVGCYTGLRYSDLSTLRPEHIDVANETINLKQRKVRKAVVVPMIDYVHEIFSKYNYDLPKIPSYTFNERVKELGQHAKLKQKIEIVRKKGTLRVKEICEKWKMMSSHTCRRSFCTNMYLSGFPAEELMRISGHKSPAAFMRYIKVDNMQAANRLKALKALRNSLNKQS